MILDSGEGATVEVRALDRQEGIAELIVITHLGAVSVGLYASEVNDLVNALSNIQQGEHP